MEDPVYFYRTNLLMSLLHSSLKKTALFFYKIAFFYWRLFLKKYIFAKINSKGMNELSHLPIEEGTKETIF